MNFKFYFPAISSICKKKKKKVNVPVSAQKKIAVYFSIKGKK